MDIFGTFVQYFNLSSYSLGVYTENIQAFDSMKNLTLLDQENSDSLLLTCLLVACFIDAVIMTVVISRIRGIQALKNSVLADVRNMLNDIYEMKEEISKSNKKAQTAQEVLSMKTATEARMMMEDFLSQNRMDEHFDALVKKLDKISAGNEKGCITICRKMDYITDDIVKILNQLEAKNKYVYEKSIQTEVSKKSVTPKRSSMSRKRISLFSPMRPPCKESAKALQESIMETIRKSLTEVRGEGNVHNFQNGSESGFTKLCDSIEQQMLQASVSLTSLMEKEFEQISQSNGVAMQCIKMFHDNTTQSITEQIKCCLKYIFEHQEKVAKDMEKKTDGLINTNQVIMHDLASLKKQNSDLVAKLNGVSVNFGEGDDIEHHGDHQTTDAFSLSSWDIKSEDISLVRNSLCNTPEPEDTLSEKAC